jgi:pimeloyl-ACP methyl ester carboxylesterase
MWNVVAKHLSTAGHRVIAYDQRGFGLSTAPANRHRYSLDRIVQDAVDVLSKLAVNDPVTVVGHDWGAFISWALCLSQPAVVRRHVAIFSGAGSRPTTIPIKMTDLMAQMGRIIDAIHSSVPESCGRRSCARSMDPSRLIHRRMRSKTMTTRRTITTPWNPRTQTRTAGPRAPGETDQQPERTIHTPGCPYTPHLSH